METLEVVQIQQGALENNAWLLAGERQALLIDAPHRAQPIADRLDQRQLSAILLTHGHFDHIDAAGEFRQLHFQAPVYLHPDDRFLWQQQHANQAPDCDLADGQEFELAGAQVRVLHTPGHTPGSVCFYIPELATVFTGDTLFPGGPGATRWEYSDFDRIIDEITTKLFTLPDNTRVCPGHGAETTIAAERPQLNEWKRRGW